MAWDREDVQEMFIVEGEDGESRVSWTSLVGSLIAALVLTYMEIFALWLEFLWSIPAWLLRGAGAGTGQLLVDLIDPITESIATAWDQVEATVPAAGPVSWLVSLLVVIAVLLVMLVLLDRLREVIQVG